MRHVTDVDLKRQEVVTTENGKAISRQNLVRTDSNNHIRNLRHLTITTGPPLTGNGLGICESWVGPTFPTTHALHQTRMGYSQGLRKV